MSPWPTIPDDVVTWFREVFAEANRRVTERLVNLPNIRETSLDDGLIESLIPETAPTLLPSGAIVRMDTHNIGGLRKLGREFWDYPFSRRWETADIAVLVFIYRRHQLLAKKIGLLQSKRIYPSNNDVDEDDAIAFVYGMNAFLGRSEPQAVGALHRRFEFGEDCIYGAIKAGSEQVRTIDDLNQRFGKAVYYLLYNPHLMPLTVAYPLQSRIRVEEIEIGSVVVDADHIHSLLSAMENGSSPSYAQVIGGSAGRAWPLETWAADMLLTCKVGEPFDSSRDDQVRYFLERRSGPIGAALAVSITLPGE